MSLYSEWLSSAVDTSVPATREMLDFMSTFDGLHYQNARLALVYARNWCSQSHFLYTHKEEQLYSDKVQMLFDVEERQQRTDVYWFEVARACDLLATEIMQNLVQDLDILAAVEAKQGYAQTALRLNNQTLAAALNSTKAAIGVCHYTLCIAAAHCKYLRQCSPQLMDSIARRYHSFRVMGCWMQGLHQLLQCEAPQKAADWFETALAIAAENDVTPAVAPLLQSTHVLKYRGFIQKALREGQRGVALGLVRDLEQAASSDALVVAPLKAETALPKAAPPPAIPTVGSPLLKISGHATIKALELGTSPFSDSDAPIQRPK